ncbi:MAG TPA: zf-HC2 domain-containing protein [Gemmatimonadaceae bacterium]|nr:zf-HC2 domain-containing protein [Gemmatimonadaceae bacterium]
MSARESMHLTDTQLDDYADGVLGAAERVMADRHLAVCEACRRAVDETGAVLAWATSERAAVRAPAELWPLVASQTVHLAEVRRAVIRSMRGVLVAGAIALAAATAVVTWKVARWTMKPATPVTRVQAAPQRGGTHAGHPRTGIAPTGPKPSEAPTPPKPPEAPFP